MRRGRREVTEDEPAEAVPAQIGPEHRVAKIIEWYPQTTEVFNRFGFGMLSNPILRRTLARGVTVAKAARVHDVNLEQFISALNAAIDRR
jgi:hypothetical protein